MQQLIAEILKFTEIRKMAESIYLRRIQTSSPDTFIKSIYRSPGTIPVAFYYSLLVQGFS